MQDRKGFSQLVTEGYQYLLPLPLPPAPGVRTKADMCPRCQSVHLSQLDTVRCRAQNADREQH